MLEYNRIDVSEGIDVIGVYVYGVIILLRY